MTQQNRFGNVMYIALWTIVGIVFMASNRVPNLKKYSPYQILIWEIKANEGYRDWWYRDGSNQGRPAYSIGFGWNDLGGKRRNEIREFTKDHRVTYTEALQITIREIKKWGQLHTDPYKNLALQLYSYNCGPTTHGYDLGKCCGAKHNCGSSKKNVRKAHNRRRRYELALWNHDWILIQKYTEENRERISKYLIKINGGAK